MNLTIQNEKLFLKVVNDSTNKKIVLKSLQISGGKNLDGTFKPSGYISVRLVKEAQENFANAVRSTNCTIETYPKEIRIENASGFLAYEKWDKGERFVAVLQTATFKFDEPKPQENVAEMPM